MKFIKENFDMLIKASDKNKFLECYLPTLDKIIEVLPAGEFEDKKVAAMELQTVTKNQLEDLFDNGYVEEEEVAPFVDLHNIIEKIKCNPDKFDAKVVKCVVVVEPKIEEVTESLNEAKSNGEELNQFFIFEDAAYCFGLQNPEDSFEKFINQFENIEFEEDELKTLKEKFAAGVEEGKKAGKEVEEEIDEAVVKEIVESFSSKESAAADLREKYKDPKYKEVIDALMEIFKEHAPEQAVEIEKAVEGKEEITEALHGMNEVEQFVKMAKAIGLKTMGDVKKFLDYEGEGKDILTALYDYLHDEIGDLEFQAKDESLNESVEEGTEEVPAPPTDPATSYLSNSINDLISGELATIKQYNDFLLSLNDDDLKEKADDSVKAVISDILNEENLHIGQLQEVLKKFSPNAESIKEGEEEAKEQLEEPVEDKKEEKE